MAAAATKSEDIRLQINNVKHKKGDGTLYLMAERLGWMPNTKNNFTISIKYADIKMQKISPEGKPKIQLQIVLHNGDNTTFQFNNLDDRTAVKDALLLILPQFKGKIPKEREKKAIMLSKNPHLLQLYKDLVETKVISAEDFWSQFVGDDDEGPDGQSAAAQPREPQPESQEVGVSANFLSGIPFNGKQVKGNVSVETLYAILKTYPKVAKKHQELVPVKMSETEFWNKFFQSRYFNRDRTKDMFTDCVKSDEKEWSSVMKKGILDPFLNVDMFSDNSYSGTAMEDPLPQSSASNENPDQLLIKRFNQHSIRLLESLYKPSSKQQQPPPSDELAATGDPSSSSKPVVNESSSQKDDAGPQTQQQTTSSATNQEIESSSSSTFRANRRDWTYDDLAGHENNGHFLDDQHKVNSKIHQVDREKYTIVPQGQQQLNAATFREHMECLQAWQPNLTECISPKDATESLKNLSPGGYLMRSTNSNRLEDTVPQELQKRLKSVYFASNELLRHFWLCFPAVEPSLESKLVKLHETLKKFEMSKLQTFHDSLSRDQRHLLNHLMRGQFKTAYRKFDSWKSKKRQRDSLRSSTKSSTSK